MEILFLLIPISVGLVFLIGVVFWWALKSGQLEDLEGPAYRILMDDDTPPRSHNTPADGREKCASVDPDQSGRRS
ncbi:MAG: cbb3-type cytochrome oxidase assembly protein CcoS [Rhodocyclaceae bacterium]|nr:cbb3-type cytochrome oxidase assembly protein CcoS [Rhodocyclaceae bacterium]